MLRRLTLHSLRALALAIAAMVMLIISVQVCGPDAEAGPSRQASQTRTVDWYYWLDTGNRQIQRARLDGSGVAQTVVSSSEMSNTNDFVLDPGGNYVYWVDDGYNQIRRKSADGTGSVETLVNTGISSPYRIAVDNSHVYWADTGNDTIQRAQAFGSHTVTTIADSSDGVSNVSAIALDGSYLYWADYGNDSVREVATFSPNTVTTLVSTGLSNPYDLEVGRNGSYVYVLDRNGTNSTIKRVATSGSHTVTTLASNTATRPWTIPSPSRWIRTTTSSTGWTRTIRRCAGLRPTRDRHLRDPDHRGGRRPHRPGGQSRRRHGVLAGQQQQPGEEDFRRWVRHGSGRDHLGPQRSESDQRFPGNGDHRRLLHHRRGHSGRRLRHPRLGGRHRRHLPVGLLHLPPRRRRGPAHHRYVVLHQPLAPPAPGRHRRRAGGAQADSSNGASTPYVYMAEAGQHTIELVREVNSANAAGGFTSRLQTQPMLSGCDVNLGTLSSDQIQVFGAYDAGCGDTRKYFFYLEFRASVAASASGVGFTPNIELRPGSASDSATPTAQSRGNPADFYQSVTSGSYRINLENITVGDTYNLSLQAFGLPPPTRTPIPTPTPRFQPNVDVRLDPDPRGVAYEDNEVYRFRVEGGAGSFPVLIRSSNATAVRVTGSSGSTLDCTAGARVDDLDQLDAVYVHVCDGGVSSTLEIIKEADYSLLAQYSIFVGGGPAPTPGAVDGPTDYGAQGEDPIGVGILVGAICDGANVDCNMELATNGLALALALFLGIAPTLAARGRPSGFSLGIGIALGLVTLLLATMWVGLPLWMVGAALLAVLGLALIGAFIKLRKLRA